MFFVVPLYLQVVLGMNALDTGIKMLPVSIAMFLASVAGSRLTPRFTVRGIVRSGLVLVGGAGLILTGTVNFQLDESGFAWGMALLGVGMGLLASQLGNVVQSSVDASGRAEAGGLQYTGQQMGSSLGVALIGAIVLTGLTTAFVNNVSADERVNAEVSSQVGIAAGTGIDFLTAEEVRATVENAGVDEATTDAIVDDYEQAQIQALKTGMLVAALLAFLSLPFTRDLPHSRLEDDEGQKPAKLGAGAG